MFFCSGKSIFMAVSGLLLLAFATTGLRAESIDAKLRVVSQSAYGPDVLGFVKNVGTQSDNLFITVSFGEDVRCSSPVSMEFPWPDPFLRSGTQVHLDVDGWVIVVRPSQLLWQVPKGCAARLMVLEDVSNDRSVVRQDISGELKAQVRRQIRVSTDGQYQVTSAVLRMDMGYEVPRDKDEELLQVQIRIDNRTNDWRDVAIVGRSVSCPEFSRAEWVIGPGDLPQGLQAGPAAVSPTEWIVFTQRLRTRGDVSKCKVSVDLAEWVYEKHFVRPRWRTFQTVEVPLISVGKLTYIVAH